jgi:hypothetical protein
MVDCLKKNLATLILSCFVCCVRKRKNIYSSGGGLNGQQKGISNTRSAFESSQFRWHAFNIHIFNLFLYLHMFRFFKNKHFLLCLLTCEKKVPEIVVHHLSFTYVIQTELNNIFLLLYMKNYTLWTNNSRRILLPKYADSFYSDYVCCPAQ